MNWKELIKESIEYTYGVTENLLNMVEDDTLSWKPATGDNWMTVGQLLHHTASGCGMPIKGFVTGDWGMPEAAEMKDVKPEDMLPPAEALSASASVAEAREGLAMDKALALELLDQCSEEQLDTQIAPAPWDPCEKVLGERMLQMVQHLALHKAQLFYYLKLQGKAVNTGHLWGM